MKNDSGAPDPVRAELAKKANHRPSLRAAGFRVVQTTGRPGQTNGRQPAASNFFAGPGDFLPADEFRDDFRW